MMSCTDFEIILADYLDGALPESERALVDQHASSCAACREFMRDVAGAMTFLKLAPDVPPPPELLTRIAYQAPMGRTRQPFEKQGSLNKFAVKWLQPILQPRWAMGMAMTILSFGMLGRCTNVQVQHIQPADLNPVRVWGGVEDKAIRMKDRAVKYYQNIRLVYEVETRLKELEDQQDAASQTQTPQAKRSASQSSQRTKNNNGASAPDQGNKKK
ncbi:MAG: zf-HC2 domain-containing protein [Bryobacteraceae bacterium]